MSQRDFLFRSNWQVEYFRLNRANLLRQCMVVLSILVVVNRVVVHAQDTKSRPNIIVVFLDDQSYLSIGSSGNRQIQTPNMDRLASDGLVFENHYNSTAICMASRASIMTGMYEYKTGCNFSHGPMHRATFRKSYPVLLRKAGYRTGFAGKFGFAVHDGDEGSDTSYDRLPISEFDSWAGGVGQTSYVTAKNKFLAKYADRYPHSSRAYGAFAQDFIKASAKDGRPFCLSLFFKAPHRPFTPDPFFDDVYKGVTFEPPENYGRKNGRHLAQQSRLGRQYLHFFRDMGFHAGQYQSTIRKYYQLIYGVDFALGMVRDELERQGLANNTVIILTSDNGFFLGAHGFGGKVLPYEEGSKAPLIIYDPRIEQPDGKHRSAALTGTVDMAPTILDCAGLPIPENMDGTSLVPVLNRPATRVREHLPLFQVWGAPPTFSMSIVTEKHKYIFWCYGDKMQPAEELFDLSLDPNEMHNIASDPKHETVMHELRRQYDQALAAWKTSAVPYNNYQQFGTILDRSIDWDKKKKLVPKPMWKQYTYLHKHLGISESAMFDYDLVLKQAN